jgi:thiamine-phosphate pyrophosphorylase
MTLAEAARRLNSSARAATRPLPPLILVTDAVRLPDPLSAAALLPSGSAVVLRHYGGPGRTALAYRLKRLCRARRLTLLVAGDDRLARKIGADGLHLSEALCRGPAYRGWGRRRPGWLVTAAAHSRAALVRAAQRGADAALLSPVFPTASHPGAPSLGPLRFAGLVRSSPLPVYGLGGITRRTARRLLGRGAVGSAALGAFPEADPDPPAGSNLVERRRHPL